jgi:hypothetical protein
MLSKFNKLIYGYLTLITNLSEFGLKQLDTIDLTLEIDSNWIISSIELHHSIIKRPSINDFNLPPSFFQYADGVFEKGPINPIQPLDE